MRLRLRHNPRITRLFRVSSSALEVICVVGLSAVAASCRHDERSALSRVRRAVLDERFTIGRLVGQQWAECRADSVAAADRARCQHPLRPGTPTFSRYERVSREVSREVRQDPSPTVLHAMALLDLRAPDASRSALDRAISSLERARVSSPDDPTLLNDLAVTYLEIGRRDQQLKPVLQALEAVDLALRRAPVLREALFNRALILEQLWLVARATEAWRAVVAAESTPGWSAEAAAHMRRLSTITDTLTSRDYPEQSRDRVFRLLGEWGRATLRGDSASADSLAGAVNTVSDSLDRLGADGSVRLTKRWLSATKTKPNRVRSVAAALIDFPDGIRYMETGRYEDAERALTNAEETLRSLGSPLAGWAALHRAAAEMNQRRFATADDRLRRIIRDAAAEQPALRGKAIWLRGTVSLRQGEFETATRLYMTSRPYFVQAKDAQNDAAISFLLTEGFAFAGQTTASFEEGYRGLRMLAPYRRSINLHNHLLSVARLARDAGLRHAPLELVTEALNVDETLKRPDALVLGLCTQARDLAVLGDSAAAFADLDRAGVVSDQLGGMSQKLARSSIDLTRGRLLRARSPDTALAVLTRAADSYREIGVWAYASAAMYELALVARDAGQTDVARARLREGVALIEHSRGSFTSVESRSAFYETVEGVFDTIIGIELDAKRYDVAYEYLERERVQLWPSRLQPSQPSTREAGALTMLSRTAPADLVFISYAVLPDRIAIWFASSRGWGEQTVEVPRDTLASLITRFTRETSGTSAAELRTRARLFSLLLDPIAKQVEGARQISIVPDRELTELSFAALWNPATRRYLVEDYIIRTEPSGAFLIAVESLARSPAKLRSAVVVGNPTVDTLSAERLQPLPGADREARDVARLYQTSSLLTSHEAKRAALLDALPKHSVFHFAGHAVFNSSRPELSYLALAVDELSPASNDRLEAREIAAMRLSNIAIVVLSACNTLNSRGSRTGAVVGLAYSFLRAGVPAIVSTLWDVADEAVGDVLVDFHRQMQRGVAAPEALRLAQVSALKSSRAELRSPAVWAALVYSGP
jgi:CHAT domain-containing protein/tetratricopeptide (TPR) repeat protein